MYDSFAIVFSIAALFGFINYRWLKLPVTISQMILSLSLGAIVIAIKPFWPGFYNFFSDFVLRTDLTHILLDVMLGFLLFAGALHVDIKDLNKERVPVFLFATLGVLISTLLVGTGVYYLAILLNCGIPFLHCLLFGALISPTDPVAVIALLETAGVSKSLQLKIEGESLFNDGIGVIVFAGLLLISEAGSAEASSAVSFGNEILKLFAEEVLVGLALGAVLGWGAFKLMKASQSDVDLSTILSMAIVFGGYSIADLVGASGPLAMVVAGLYIGDKIKSPDFHRATQKQLEGFWYILDDSLNGVLFVLLGLAVHLVQINEAYILLSFGAILIVIAARFIAVLAPFSLLKHGSESWFKTTSLLTWGGLRGGISLALAFSIAPEFSRETILMLTYTVVVFSIIVQGLSLKRVTRYLYPGP